MRKLIKYLFLLLPFLGTSQQIDVQCLGPAAYSARPDVFTLPAATYPKAIRHGLLFIEDSDSSFLEFPLQVGFNDTLFSIVDQDNNFKRFHIDSVTNFPTTDSLSTYIIGCLVTSINTDADSQALSIQADTLRLVNGGEVELPFFENKVQVLDSVTSEVQSIREGGDTARFVIQVIPKPDTTNSGDNIYTIDGTVSGDRDADLNSNDLNFHGGQFAVSQNPFTPDATTEFTVNGDVEIENGNIQLTDFGHGDKVGNHVYFLMVDEFGNVLEQESSGYVRQWTQMPSPVTSNILDMGFFDEFTGWISDGGSNAGVQKTEDGGQTWTHQSIPNFTTPQSIFILSKEVLFAGDTELYRSLNGGDSWTEIEDNSGVVWTQYWFHQDSGHYANNSSDIYRTVNGGTSWVGEGLGYRVFDVDFEGDNGALGGAGAKLVLSDDRGASFKDEINVGLYGIVGDITEVDVTEEYVFFTEGGKVWRYEYLSQAIIGTTLSNNSITDLDFCDNLTGYAVSSTGGIWLTQNSGGNWTRQYSETPNLNYTSVECFGSTNGRLTSTTGTVEKPSTYAIPQQGTITVDPEENTLNLALSNVSIAQTIAPELFDNIFTTNDTLRGERSIVTNDSCLILVDGVDSLVLSEDFIQLTAMGTGSMEDTTIAWIVGVSLDGKLVEISPDQIIAKAGFEDKNIAISHLTMDTLNSSVTMDTFMIEYRGLSDTIYIKDGKLGIGGQPLYSLQVFGASKFRDSIVLDDKIVYSPGVHMRIEDDLPTSVLSNFEVGRSAGTNGNDNIFIGHNAGSKNVIGTNTIALGFNTLANVDSSNHNTAIAANALRDLIDGTGNVAIGNNAGRNRASGSRGVFLGDGSGRWSEGDNVVFIGSNAGNDASFGGLDSIIVLEVTNNFPGRFMLDYKGPQPQMNLDMELNLLKYGDGTYADTVDWYLGIDSSGNLFTVSPDQVGGGSSDNVYNIDGTLTGDRTVSTGNNALRIDNGNNDVIFDVANTNSIIGIEGTYTMNSNPMFYIQNSNSERAWMQFRNSTTGSTVTDGFRLGINDSEQAEVWNYENSSLRFGTNNTERFVIDGSGNVDISGPYFEWTNGDHDMSFNTPAGETGLIWNINQLGNRSRFNISNMANATAANRYMDFRYNDDAAGGALTVQYGGNVGIGINPEEKFHVYMGDGGTPNTGDIAVFEDNESTKVRLLGGTSHWPEIAFGSSLNNRGAYINYATAGENLQIATDEPGASVTIKSGDNTVAMTIDSQQRVGIGTTTPDNIFQIKNNVATGGLDNLSEYQILLYESGVATEAYGFGIRSNTLIAQTNDKFDIDVDAVNRHSFDASKAILGNYEFDTDQSVGASQDDYVLTYDNSDGQISLEPAGGGSSKGSRVLIAKTDITSSVATVDFTGLDTTYHEYYLEFSEVIPVTDNVEFHMRIGTGATTWQTSNYRFQGTPTNSSNSQSKFGSGNTSIIRLVDGYHVGSSANEFGVSGRMHFFINGRTQYPRVWAWLHYENNSGAFTRVTASGEWVGTTQATGLRFYFSSGNIESGTITLYGIVK